MFKSLALLFLLFHQLCLGEYKYNLSVCAIFQDEAPYLKEWIEFHRLVGVEHFYLYNHRSSDHYLEVLKPYIASGLVELKNKHKVAKQIRIFNCLQRQCYTECLASARGTSKWVAFIDIDEFLVPMKEQNLPEILKKYENFGGLYANWRVFGTSSVKKIPKEKLLIETLVCCTPQNAPINRYVKSIVRPECADHFLNPHNPVYRKGFYQVNTDTIPFEGILMSSSIQTNKLRINHYWTRDESFFSEKKLPRWKRWGTKLTRDLLEGVNAEKDEAILRFVPALKKAMNSK
jgi:glycosyl transferase family 92